MFLWILHASMTSRVCQVHEEDFRPTRTHTTTNAPCTEQHGATSQDNTIQASDGMFENGRNVGASKTLICVGNDQVDIARIKESMDAT